MGFVWNWVAEVAHWMSNRCVASGEWCADVQALADGLGTWRELRDARRKVRP